MIGITLFSIIILSGGALWLFTIYKSRGSRVRMFKALAIPILVIAAFIIIINIYESSRIPISAKVPRSYIMNVNETESASGTRIKLKKVLLDLKHVDATYSVWGREKVVAIELKKNPEDIQPLKEMTGLWVGSRLFGESSSFGMPYNEDNVLDPVYIIFYLSDGQGVSFKITDKANVKNNTSIIFVNKTINYDNLNITFTKFNSGLGWSWVDFKSNFNPSSIINVSLIVNGRETGISTSGWAGGGNGYNGAYYFDPVNSGQIQLKVVNKSKNKADIIDIR